MIVVIDGLKGQRAYSPEQRPGYRDNPVYASSFTHGVAQGWWLLPLRGDKMPQRERLIELNKIAIQQMKVLEGVEERRMLK